MITWFRYARWQPVATIIVALVIGSSGHLLVFAAPPSTAGWASSECIGINAPCTPGGSAPTTVNPANFHPGHYMSVGTSTGTKGFSRIAGNPNFVGIKRSYKWVELETALGVYDFSRIASDLASAQSLGKRYWISIRETATNSNDLPWVPSYMWNDPKYGCGPRYYGTYERTASNGGWIVCFWNERTRDRFAALYTALGARFNGEPYFEGINLGETAINTSAAKACDCGYSAAAVKAAFQHIALAAKVAFPDKSVMQMINFAPYNLADFATWLAANGIGIGTPDVALHKNFLITVIFPQFVAYHNLVPTGPDVQWGNYKGNTAEPGHENVVETILLGAIEHTDPWYMFWRNREPWFTEQVIPIIGKHGQLPAAREFYNSVTQ